MLAATVGTTRPAAARPAVAQQPAQQPDQPLQVSSVTPWVAPDGEFQVRFAPSTSVPPDADLTVTIHQSLQADDEQSLRESLIGIIEGASPGRVLQTPATVPFGLLGDPAAGATLTIPVRSTRGDAQRILLPNPGIHPIEMVLTRPDGPELWRQTVFLNRLPEPDRTDRAPAPVRVTLLLPVGSAPAVGPGGTASFTGEEQAELSAATSLLSQVPDAPLTLSVRPNTLDGLVRSDQRWAAELLASLRTERDDTSVALASYVEVDSGALVGSGVGAELEQQILVGAGTTASRLGRPPDVSVWAGDDTLTTAVLPILASAGVRSVLLPRDALDPGDAAPAQIATTSAVRLEGGEGIRALALDDEVAERIEDDSVEPGVRAHQGVSLMMAGWFTAAEQPEAVRPATAVLLAPGTDPEILESLTATLDSNGPLVAEPDAGPIPEPPAGSEEPVVALRDRSTPDVRVTVEAADQTRRQISSYRSMTGEADTDATIWDELANESVASTLDARARADLHASVRNSIAAKVALIEPPRARRVVVTSRDTVIPLRFRNGLPFEVRLVMRARSPRLEIDEPTTEIVLQPGENRVDLPVRVQAPGESLLRIELSAPDGGITIPGPDVPVRSTAISGVGAALSAVSVLFLLGWWFNTMRRRQRDRARDRRVHPSEEAPAEPVPTGRLGEGG